MKNKLTKKLFHFEIPFDDKKDKTSLYLLTLKWTESS